MAGIDWVNPDGLLVRFGPNQGVRGNKAGVTKGAGHTRELVFNVDLTSTPATKYTADLNGDGVNDGFSGLDTPIPANAVITRQLVRTLVTPVGGTNYSVDTFARNGTVNTTAGIRTTAGADGSQIGTQNAVPLYVTATTSGTYTAGKIQVVISYLY